MRRRLSACLLRLAAVAAAAAAVVPATAGAAVGDEILVHPAADAGAVARADTRSDAGVHLVDQPVPGVELVAAPDGDRAAALAALRRDPDVAWAEPNHVTHAFVDFALPTDPYMNMQWGLENTGLLGSYATTADADIDAADAWPVTMGAGVTVAVADSGVLATHPDLADRLIAGHDFIDGGSDTTDVYGHGTHVSGIIAAAANGIGTVGVAPQASIEPLRVLDDTGSGSTADTAAAFEEAGEQGVRVLNASLGSQYSTTAELQAIQEHPNTLYVAAAGNDGKDLDGGAGGVYPCSYTAANVICVGASNWNDQPAPFSNRGRKSVDLFAPGDSIYSTYRNNNYAWMSGTSMAAPMVAGAAALVAAAHPEYTAGQIKRILLSTVDHPPALAGLSVTGGRLNVGAALTASGSVPTVDRTPPDAPTGLRATVGDGQVRLDWNPVGATDLAGYRVYEASGDDEFLPVDEPGGATTSTLRDLVNGKTYSFRVTAVDLDGNESAASPTVMAVPAVPHAAGTTAAVPSSPVASPPSAKPAGEPVGQSAPAVQAPATTAPHTGAKARKTAAASITRLRVVGHPTARRSSKARLEITLNAAAPVRLTLRQRVCRRHRCHYSRAVSHTVKLGAGRRRLRLDGRVAGMRLRSGTWRLTVTVGHHGRTVTLHVRR